uniref:Uncharacterized protein n=1 Tax=Knipowitschia caucasica TaxID=637954 RepID=A0AAV2JHG7_KNICA
MVSFRTGTPFPDKAQSVPPDYRLSDKGRQLSVHTVRVVSLKASTGVVWGGGGDLYDRSMLITPALMSLPMHSDKERKGRRWKKRFPTY